MLTLLALTRLSCSKGLQLKFLKTLLTLDANCCWNAGVSLWWGSTAWDLEGALIPSLNLLNTRTSSGPEVPYSLRPVESGLFNRWVAPPSPFVSSLFPHQLDLVPGLKNLNSLVKRKIASVEFFIQATCDEF